MRSPAMRETPVLALHGFGVSYGARPVLADLDLEVAGGEVVALVGASGAGKTALLRAILGLSPSGATARGTLGIAGRDLSAATPAVWRAVRGREVAWVPQDPLTALPSHRTVGAVLDEVVTAHPRGRDRGLQRARAAAVLAEVGLPADFRLRYPHQLSGGQGQRVLLALALAGEPALLLADEPTSALDPIATREILDLVVHQARHAGRAVLLVSHDLEATGRVADRVAVLAGGRLLEVGPARTVLTAAYHPYVEALVAARPTLAPPHRTPLPSAPTAMPCAPAEAGCGFALQCPRVQTRCRERVPHGQTHGAHTVACYAPGEPS
jgi:peptide/nickel transport system ATP-binding protein